MRAEGAPNSVILSLRRTSDICLSSPIGQMMVSSLHGRSRVRCPSEIRGSSQAQNDGKRGHAPYKFMTRFGLRSPQAKNRLSTLNPQLSTGRVRGPYFTSGFGVASPAASPVNHLIAAMR